MNYTVFKGGKRLNTFATTVYPAPYNETNNCEFVLFTQDEKTELKIKSAVIVDSVVIRPLSLGIEFSHTNSEITVIVDKPCNFSVEINGDYKTPLLVFASPKRNYDFSDKKVITIKKEDCEKRKIEIKEDNTVLYFEDGAVLNGKIELNGCKNISVLGNGIIDGKNCLRLGERVRFDVLACENVEIKDVVITDSLFWNLRIFSSKNVSVDNVRIIGYRANTDGIDVCSSRNVHVQNCFTRVWDDSLVVKAFDDSDKTSPHVVFEGSDTDMRKAFENTVNTENVLFEKCVLWNDFARPIEVGVSLRADKVKNIVFKDIDIIHSPTGYPLMGIHHGDRAEVSDIIFEDIRIEDAPGAQLLDFRITDSAWNLDSKKGCIHDISFKNIKLIGKPMLEILPEKSRLEGFSEENSIKNISFTDISLFGKTARSPDEMGLDIKEYVYNVSVTGSGEKINTIRSSVYVKKPFRLFEGMYKGNVAIKLENISDNFEKGSVRLFVAPKNSCEHALEFKFFLNGGETAEKEYELTLPAGKFIAGIRSDCINVLPSWTLIELDWEADKMNPLEFYNFYGTRKSGVSAEIKDNRLILHSNLLKEYDFTLYTAMPVPIADGEVRFTVEETDFALAPAVIREKGRDVSAPQLRCPAEIFYVFNNAPKVSEIRINKLRKNPLGKAELPFSELGITEGSKEIWSEIEIHCPDTKNLRYPLTLFHSVTPDKTAHMFGRLKANE